MSYLYKEIIQTTWDLELRTAPYDGVALRIYVPRKKIAPLRRLLKDTMTAEFWKSFAKKWEAKPHVEKFREDCNSFRICHKPESF
jgi:hypothetical protein